MADDTAPETPPQPETTSTAAGRVARLGTGRLCLGAIAAFMATTGVQAALAPRSFYDDFPFGRGWVVVEGGNYDEHLVRDVGVLFLALILVTAWSAWKGEFIVPVAAAWLLQGVAHFVYHVDHLDGLDGIDKAGLLVSLGVVPLLAAAALLSETRATNRR